MLGGPVGARRARCRRRVTADEPGGGDEDRPPARTPRAARPTASMPSVPPAPANPAQMPTALARSSGGKTLVMVDSVPGMMQRRADAHDRPQRDELARRCRRRPATAVSAEHDDAGDERASPPEAVAEGAGGQQQGGERRRRRRRRSTAGRTGWPRGPRRGGGGRCSGMATPATIIATVRHIEARVAVCRGAATGGPPGGVSDTVSTAPLFVGQIRKAIFSELRSL